MRYVGRIIEWNDERGFGFIASEGSEIRTVVHATAFRRGSPRPVDGMVVSYEIVLDDKGRFKASRPRLVARSAPVNQARVATWRGMARQGIAALFLIAIAACCRTSQFPACLALAYAIMSAIAFTMYGLDKSAAMNRRWRTRETMLHAVSLFGGWPGALFAQEAFRHKISKSEFQALFRFIVAINCGALAWLLSSGHMELVDRAVVAVMAGNHSSADHHPVDVRITPMQ